MKIEAMKFDVYCDESNPEVLKDKSANKFLVLGSIWLPTEVRQQFKTDIADIKEKHGYNNEIKWNKVSPSNEVFIHALIKYFFANKNLRFRALLVESEKVDLIKFHQDDGELSFYKFYYQLLHHWIYDYNDYSVFIDHKVNKDHNRISKLWEVLDKANLFSSILNVQAIHSKESLGIQIADLLTGCINGKFNGNLSSSAKLSAIAEIEKWLDHPIRQTSKSVEKFNIFRINLQGGW